MEHQLQTALKGLKMPGMAACWQSMEETHQSEKLSLRDGLQILIQAEKDSRDSNRIAKLIKNANFRIQALIEELEISETRGVPADIILQLSSGEYIKAGSTVIICGATGTGKSYLACALGNKACRLGYKVAYYTMQKLMDAIRIARLEGKDQKLLDKFDKLDVLIIDDFEQILDDRYGRKSLIISSQLPVSDWHALFKNELIADACIDRMVHKPVRFQLVGYGNNLIM